MKLYSSWNWLFEVENMDTKWWNCSQYVVKLIDPIAKLVYKIMRLSLYFMCIYLTKGVKYLYNFIIMTWFASYGFSWYKSLLISDPLVRVGMDSRAKLRTTWTSDQDDCTSDTKLENLNLVRLGSKELKHNHNVVILHVYWDAFSSSAPTPQNCMSMNNNSCTKVHRMWEYICSSQSIGYRLNKHAYNSQENMMDNSMVPSHQDWILTTHSLKDAAGGSLESRKTLSLS